MSERCTICSAHGENHYRWCHKPVVDKAEKEARKQAFLEAAEIAKNAVSVADFCPHPYSKHMKMTQNAIVKLLREKAEEFNKE